MGDKADLHIDFEAHCREVIEQWALLSKPASVSSGHYHNGLLISLKTDDIVASLDDSSLRFSETQSCCASPEDNKDEQRSGEQRGEEQGIIDGHSSKKSTRQSSAEAPIGISDHGAHKDSRATSQPDAKDGPNSGRLVRPLPPLIFAITNGLDSKSRRYLELDEVKALVRRIFIHGLSKAGEPIPSHLDTTVDELINDIISDRSWGTMKPSTSDQKPASNNAQTADGAIATDRFGLKRKLDDDISCPTSRRRKIQAYNVEQCLCEKDCDEQCLNMVVGLLYEKTTCRLLTCRNRVAQFRFALINTNCGAGLVSKDRITQGTIVGVYEGVGLTRQQVALRQGRDKHYHNPGRPNRIYRTHHTLQRLIPINTSMQRALDV